jgi:hypothetical protein
MGGLKNYFPILDWLPHYKKGKWKLFPGSGWGTEFATANQHPWVECRCNQHRLTFTFFVIIYQSCPGQRLSW